MKRTILIAVLSSGLIACTSAVDNEEPEAGESALDASSDEQPSPEANEASDGETGLGVPAFPEEDAPQAVTITIPAETELIVEIARTISAAESSADDPFTGILASPVEVDGTTVLPAGTPVAGRVVSARESGRVQGVASIELTLATVEVGGQTYNVSSAPFVAQAETERTEDAQRIGVGAGLGALVGAIAGGGDGAAIGAAIGGGAGTAVVLTDRGDDVVLPAETAIRFLLDEAVTVTQ